MKLIRTKDDLLDLLVDGAPTKAAETAIRERKGITILGGFTTPEGYSGWVVRLTLPAGRVWHLAVWTDEKRQRYLIQFISEAGVPWAGWLGTSNGKRPLCDGDEPVQTAFKRMMARRKHAPANS